MSACVQNGDAPPRDLLNPYLGLLPRLAHAVPQLDSMEAIAREEAMLQVIRDVLTVEETVGGGSGARDRYAALGCQLSALATDSAEHKEVLAMLERANRRKLRFNVRTVYSISRYAEESAFAHEMPNKRLLFHGSSMHNWLGICSRGLLLPRSVEGVCEIQTVFDFFPKVATVSVYACPFTSFCLSHVEYFSPSPLSQNSVYRFP